MLTNQEIDTLYAFCRKHSVEFYDVQVELVDHLANAIEDKMAAKPGLAFEAALKEVHKGFGVRGFAPLVKEKQKALRKYNNKRFYALLREQLRWPKIFVALSVFAGAYTILTVAPKWLAQSVLIAGFLLLLVATVVASSRLSCFQRKTKQKFLLVATAGLTNLVFLPINFFNIMQPFISSKKEWLSHAGMLSILLFCLLFTLYAIFVLASYQAMKQVHKELEKDYGHLLKPVQ